MKSIKNNINFLLQPNKNYIFLLLALISLDIFFIVASWLHYNTNLILNDSFSITKDFGYAEIAQYWKEFAIAVLLFNIFKKTGDGIFIVWSLLFNYMLLDDSLRIHEAVGNTIDNQFFLANSLPLNLRGQDFGELVIISVVGSVFLLFFIRYFYKSKQTIKNISFNLASLVVLLLFFGVFIDLAHSAFPNARGITTLEDGGEMIAMSLICWYSFNVFKHSPETVLSILNKPSLNLLNLIASYLYQLIVYLGLYNKKTS